MTIGEGKGNLSGERFPFLPNPTPSSSKTFPFIESLFGDAENATGEVVSKILGK